MAANQQNVRWVPPLPAGWEAKFDPTQQRYFFIDHTTKKTTWDDPRFSRGPVAQQHPPAQHQQYGYGQYQHPQQQQQQQYYPQQQQQQHYPQQQYGHPQQRYGHQQQAEAIPMKTLAQQYIAGQGQGFYDQAARSGQPSSSAASNLQPSPRRQPQPQQQVQQTEAAQEEESSFVEDLPEFECDETLVKHLRQKYPTCPVETIRRTVERNCNAPRASDLELEVYGYKKVTSPRRSLSPTNQSAEGRRNSAPSENDNISPVVQKLKREYPNAEVGFIQDILALVNNSEHEAREQLKSMGYSNSSTAAGSSNTAVKTTVASRGPAESTQSSSRPAGKQAPLPSKPAASQSKTAMSSAMKATLVAGLAREHPNLDKTIVELALETADNNVQKARDMLTFMYTDNSTTSPKKTSPTRQTAVAAATATTSSSIPDVSVSAGTSDAGYDEISQDYYLYDNYARPESVTSVSRDQRRSPSPYKTKGDNQRQRGKTEERRPKHVSRITVGPKEVVTTQSQVATSRHKTVAKGPDPELCQGADLSRVERYGVLTNGPNRNLRKGPDPNRVKGSQGAKGHDPSLCRGPQPELHQGHQPNLCRGPATIITASRTLISQV